MTLSTLPLSYCTNVHPGQTIAEIDAGRDRYTVKVQHQLERPLAAGLWLAQPVVAELQSAPESLPAFVERLQQRDLACYTLNAFPYGDFHSERVKENVYIPDWTTPERLQYTHDCARILAALMPEGTEGSISTVPLGFKEFEHPDDFNDRACTQLIELARRLDELYDDTGKLVRLAIEPEPFCLLETTDEAIAFFEDLWQRADKMGVGDVVRQTIGLCYDVCHQAVEFEEIDQSIHKLVDAGVRINKVHITCAIEIDNPAENEAGRRALADYVEPRYLHQTMARASTGDVHRLVDLTTEHALQPPAEFLQAEKWRVHFHVPVNAESLGPLGTTRNELRQALATVAALEYAPHLEVETYTWQVLPGQQSEELVDGLTREMTATHELLATTEGINPSVR